MSTRPFHRLRVVGRLEGVSFLLLLGVAMPLKYLGDMPVATKIVGWPHGMLFILYCYLVAIAVSDSGLKPSLATKLVIAALLPFGPFVAERYLEHD